MSLNKQPCISRYTVIDLNPCKYEQGLRYYPFMANLYRCNGICNTLNDPSSTICVTNKRQNAQLNVFNMMSKINESKK